MKRNKWKMSQTKYVLMCLFVFWMSLQPMTLAQPDREIVVFAASSLTNTFTEISEAYEAQYDVQVTLNFAGSLTLAAQLLQGAPADVFASANDAQMQILIDDLLVDDSQVEIFAENELTLIVPADNPAEISSVTDLTGRNILLALAAPSVPVRLYTDQLLQTLAAEYGDDFPDAVLRNLVSEEFNVRQVVARVALGEVDAGIVYRTDMTPDVMFDLQTIALPDGSSPRANYSITPVIDAPNPDEAVSFVDFVLSDSGQAILQAWGFCAPEMLEPENTPEPEMTPELEMTPDVETNC